MLFNSYAFVFVFLPLFVIGFYTFSYFTCAGLSQKPSLARRLEGLYFVIFSFVFFSFFGIKVLGVLIISLIWNYIFLRLLGRGDFTAKKENSSNNARNIKAILFIAILGNLALLLFFKYAGFFASLINFFLSTSISASMLLPIAISFYTFSQISLIVDVYRGEVIDISLIDYLAYITFFPKILQGPIVRYNDMREEFDKALSHKWNSEDFMQALMFFVLGLSKKVIIADTLGVAVDYGYESLSTLTAMDAVLTSICYSFQIYFDFSGYCDMGRGICKMIGMDLPVNFESPYKARNIDDFWKRWHITLTGFFTRYVYIPLGGNRKGRLKTYINFMIIFILSGFWHGAGISFIIWGAMHGVLYVITRALRNRLIKTPNASNTVNKSEQGYKLLPYPIALILTFIFVTIAWIFFRADTLADAACLIQAMFQNTSLKISQGFIECFQIDELWYIFKMTPLASKSFGPALCMWIIIAVSAFFAFISPSAARLTERHKVTLKGAIVLAILLVFSIIKFANVSTYIYLGF